jgi:hypothetical protein
MSMEECMKSAKTVKMPDRLGDALRWAKSKANIAHGIIYIVECERYYKIGQSINFSNRLAGIVTSLPFKVSVTHTISVPINTLARCEKYLHKLYKKKHHKGEWYMLDVDDVDYIKALTPDELVALSTPSESICTKGWRSC